MDKKQQLHQYDYEQRERIKKMAQEGKTVEEIQEIEKEKSREEYLKIIRGE